MAEPTTDPGRGSPFWQFSLRFYRLPGVAEACIELQEQAGVDVNLLLFLLWQASLCRRLSPPMCGARGKDRPLARGHGGAAADRAPCAQVAAGVGRRPRPPKRFATASRRWSWKRNAYSRRRCSHWRQFGVEVATAEEAARANIAAYEEMRRMGFPPAATATLLAAFTSMTARRGR